MFDISIIVPAFNEEESITKIIGDILAFMPEISEKFEIIVIDDGSSDRTGNIAENLATKDNRIRVIHHAQNRGFGEAQKTGIANSKFNFITLIPADGQFAIKDLEIYLPHLLDADIVSGYRVKRKDPLFRKFNTKLYNLSFRILFGLKTRDVDWVKIYNRKIFNTIAINSGSALVDAEILMKAAKRGFKIKEVGVPHYPRIFGRQSGGDLKVIFRAFTDLFKLWKGLND